MEASGSDSLESIRKRVKDISHYERSRKRKLAFDSHRKYLSDIEKTLKAPTLSEMADLCKRIQKHKHVADLKKLQTGLAEGGKHVSTCFKGGATLYALTGCLTGNDIILQVEAACAFVNLGMGTEKECLYVCNKAGTYLVLLIYSGNQQLQDLSAWSIGNLCGNHKRVCELLQKQGVEEALQHLLASMSRHVLQSATYAIMHYISTVPHRINNFASQTVIRQLIDALNRNESMISEVGWCLFYASVEQNICHVIVDYGGLTAMFSACRRLLQEQNPRAEAITPLIRTLINCMGCVKGAPLQACYYCDLIPVLSDLLYSPHPHLQEETLQLLANIVIGASETETGRCVLDDISLKPRLNNALQRAMAGKFSDHSLVAVPFD
ncbi:uncharacterized protein LOC143022576 [Oratosquilla oratoria]|uniref:uncharacterized protein LOC143022576 n=1 Tax=Oratosquilla oratoria TaxID=337810 RepID=UPI003F76974C